MGLKSTGKRWIKKSAMTSGVLRLAARMRPAAAIVLMYHSVMDDPRDCANSIGVGNIHATEAFRNQMEMLARSHNPLTVEDIRLFLSGQKPMPRRAVAVTFDDGYADNFEVGAPVLARLGIPASFYLTAESVDTGIAPWFCHLRHAFTTTKKRSWVDATGGTWALDDGAQRDVARLTAFSHLARLVGSAQQEALCAIELDLDIEPLAPKKRLMMTWDQARRLRQQGHVVGSHSLTHPNMAHIADDNLNYELMESKRKMEDELATPVVHFSYPAAALTVSWTRRTVAASQKAGYRTAVTTTRGVVSEGNNPLCLRRIGAPDDVDEFRWELQYAPLERSIRRLSRLRR
jgi:peptidoglycan/xylan/chitin deacetylase (PgdA/CDA1 family)